MTRKPAASSPISTKRRPSFPRPASKSLGGASDRPAAGTANPDDSPAWTNEQLARAELAEGGKVLRPATGTLKRGPGRPRVENPKRQISVRLDPEVIEALQRQGAGWQRRMNDTLRKALGIK